MLRLHDRNRFDGFVRTALFMVGLVSVMAFAVAGEAGITLKAFEDRYAQIVREVDSNKLPTEAGEQAKEIRFNLKRALIGVNARIETAKLEASELSGATQKKALDTLVAASADRERLILQSLSRLESVASGRPVTLVAPVTPVAPSTQDSDSETPTSASTNNRFLSIESAPEDVTTGEFE